MKFIELNMSNWMIYRGEQILKFPQEDHANVLVLFGENMHGKTTILNAIRWCLYGQAIDRYKKPISKENLINNIEAEAGGKSVKVSLKFEADGLSFDLERSLDLTNLHNPVEKPILRKDGRAVEGGKIKTEIEQLVPQQLSQFLLFDGELLKEFEDLVALEGSNQARNIKDSIEKALGIPIFEKAIRELDKIGKTYSKERNAKLKNDKQVANLAGQLERHESDLTTQEEEIVSLEGSLDQTRGQIEELKAKVEKNNENIELNTKLKGLKDEHKKILEEITDYKEKKVNLTTNLWKVPLFETLKPKIDDIKEKIKSLRDKSTEASENMRILLYLERAIKGEICDQCGQKVVSHELEKLKEKKKNIESTFKPENYEEQMAELQRKVFGLELKEGFEASIGELRLVDREINNRNGRNIQIDNEIDDLNIKLKNVDTKDLNDAKRQLELYMQNQGRSQERLEKCHETKKRIELAIHQIKNDPLIKSASQNYPGADLSVETDRLRATFRSAADNYRDSIREEIEARANSTFRELTTETNFDKLEMNESYGLSLIIDNKKVFRSAGAEQIVALSLIEALNHLGRRKGPMLMDTPSGRLDMSHRKNIMEFLPTAVTQLIMFVHSGELDEGDIYFDESVIGKKYKIERVGSFEARLEEK